MLCYCYSVFSVGVIVFLLSQTVLIHIHIKKSYYCCCPILTVSPPRLEGTLHLYCDSWVVFVVSSEQGAGSLQHNHITMKESSTDNVHYSCWMLKFKGPRCESTGLLQQRTSEYRQGLGPSAELDENGLKKITWEINININFNFTVGTRTYFDKEFIVQKWKMIYHKT